MFEKLFYKIFHVYILRKVEEYLDCDNSLMSKRKNNRLRRRYDRCVESLYELGYMNSSDYGKYSIDVALRRTCLGKYRYSRDSSDSPWK